MLLEVIKVNTGYWVTSLYLGACFYFYSKRNTFKAYCFQAYMHEKLNPVLCLEAKCVTGLCNSGQGTIYRAANAAIAWDDGYAITEDFAGKDWIRHICQRNHFAAQR